MLFTQLRQTGLLVGISFTDANATSKANASLKRRSIQLIENVWD